MICISKKITYRMKSLLIPWYSDRLKSSIICIVRSVYLVVKAKNALARIRLVVITSLCFALSHAPFRTVHAEIVNPNGILSRLRRDVWDARFSGKLFFIGFIGTARCDLPFSARAAIQPIRDS